MIAAPGDRALLDIVKLLVEPPASLFVVVIAGLVLARRWRRTGRTLVLLAFILLYIVSTPLVGHALLRTLEADFAVEPPKDAAMPGAIVILSAGIKAADFAGNRLTVDALTLERLRRGAALHRATGLPVLLSGGRPQTGSLSLAGLMAVSLRDDYGIEPRWIEERSATTAENAIHSAEILRTAGIGRIYLVTQAWHLPRSMQAFRQQGLTVVPAPASFEAPAERNLIVRLIPSANALARSRFALHEYIGRLWLALGGTA